MNLALSVLFVVALPGMQHGIAATSSGTVVAAPHEGFDEHTAPIAKAIAGSLGSGWVVAEGHRQLKEQRWLDVNRPTQRLYEGKKLLKPKETAVAREVYTAYQALLRTAGRRPTDPLDLLVEIHGHARAIKREGQGPLKVQAIELATRGFDKPALRKLKLRYIRLQAALDPADRVTLAVEQLDPTYRFGGRRLKFHFRASGSKRSGSLSPRSTRRALHFELPPRVRFNARRRGVYAELLAELLRSGL